MPTTMFSKVRRVLLVLAIARNSDWNRLSMRAIHRRTGVDHRDQRRILAVLRRRGMATSDDAGWFLTPKGAAYARRIQDAFVNTDNARRAAAHR